MMAAVPDAASTLTGAPSTGGWAHRNWPPLSFGSAPPFSAVDLRDTLSWGDVRLRRRILESVSGPPIEVWVEGRTPPWFDPTLDDLEEVLRLPPNWNSYRARPVDAQAAVAAIELLVETMPDSLSRPTVIPTVRGSIQLEWHTRGIDLEIDVLANGRYAIFFEDDQTGASWERETGEAAGAIRPVLAELALRMATNGR
jgi:hypothetical protein